MPSIPFNNGRLTMLADSRYGEDFGTDTLIFDRRPTTATVLGKTVPALELTFEATDPEEGTHRTQGHIVSIGGLPKMVSAKPVDGSVGLEMVVTIEEATLR